ncbi:DUF4259 domain-containing protein [Streptosporangium sp. NPDC048865]|uniref:DUF4259 domain-containing protein n=1 Tax=Streptosporangium sp. NPDC048865 TaxID=3155766 RepID=UPI003414805E
MGAWGMGPFDNDGALDSLDDLEDGFEGDPEGDLEVDLQGDFEGGRSTARRLAVAMREVLDEDGYVEGPEMSGAVAVACLVGARVIGAEPDGAAARWLENNPFEPSAELRNLARATIDRATRPDDNELYELWEDSGSLNEWLATLVPYRRALA